MTPRVVFDVSALLRDPHMSGIARVSIAVASALLDDGDPGSAFCRFDPVHRLFEEVDPATVRSLVAHTRDRHVPLAEPVAETRTGVLRQLGERALADRPATARTLRRAGFYSRRAAVEATRLPRALREDRHGRPRPCFSGSWTTDTTYVSLAFDYHDVSYDYLAHQRARQRFSTVLTAFDLTTVVTPQYHAAYSVWDPHLLLADEFRIHFTRMLTTADRLLVISEATRRDVERFAAEQGVPVPETVHLPLGSSIPRHDRMRPAALGAPGAPLPGAFVLTVGTIEIRKNHRLLLDVWETMLRDLPRDEVPPLVVAGRTGWLFQETVARLERTPAFAGTVVHLDGPTDAELAWCYESAAFTCYPSLYEGWGLPVSESLAFGRPCLSSDTSSLPEAGAGLTTLLDPLDRNAWRDAVLDLWRDPAARAAVTERIQREYVNVDADATARVVLGTARSLPAP